MAKSTFLKLLIVLAVALGELTVWLFPYENHDIGYELPTVKPVIAEENNTGDEIDNEDLSEPATGETEEKPSDISKGILILVNKTNYLEESYKPEDLYPIDYYAKDRSPESRYMRKEAAEAFNKMAQDALEEGYEIVMTTAYRSFDFQKLLYDNYIKAYGQAEADKFSAKPGTSEHQTGLAVDISTATIGYELSLEFENTEEWNWLNENAAKYGFIQRYPNGKTNITGYMYEPWHFRYVGAEKAQIIKRENITLEEFLNK